MSDFLINNCGKDSINACGKMIIRSLTSIMWNLNAGTISKCYRIKTFDMMFETWCWCWCWWDMTFSWGHMWWVSLLLSAKTTTTHLNWNRQKPEQWTMPKEVICISFVLNTRMKKWLRCMKSRYAFNSWWNVISLILLFSQEKSLTRISGSTGLNPISVSLLVSPP